MSDKYFKPLLYFSVSKFNYEKNISFYYNNVF